MWKEVYGRKIGRNAGKLLLYRKLMTWLETKIKWRFQPKISSLCCKTLTYTFIYLNPQDSESEFNEFEPPLKSSKNRFQMSAGLKIKYHFKWNQPYLRYGLNLSRGSNSFRPQAGFFYVNLCQADLVYLCC